MTLHDITLHYITFHYTTYNCVHLFCRTQLRRFKSESATWHEWCKKKSPPIPFETTVTACGSHGFGEESAGPDACGSRGSGTSRGPFRRSRTSEVDSRPPWIGDRPEYLRRRCWVGLKSWGTHTMWRGKHASLLHRPNPNLRRAARISRDRVSRASEIPGCLAGAARAPEANRDTSAKVHVLPTQVVPSRSTRKTILRNPCRT